jgi:Tol biopolymer transport system component/DNA-binding winged helix-turn-helix (wHTH) protein
MHAVRQGQLSCGSRSLTLLMNARPNSGGEMPESQSAQAVVCFDVFEVDLRAGELRKEGRKIKVQEQPFRVLSYLLERAGDVVTREELRQKLWPADTFVDFDHGLNSAVARLREALRDSAEKPRFVETVAKRGYRFIGLLRAAPPVFVPALAPSVLQPADQQRAGVRRQAAGKIWMSTAFFVVLFSMIAIWPLRRPKANSDSQPSRIEVVPLISLRGFQATPAFSPSGTLVAFREHDGAHSTGIFAAAVGGEKSVQVTNDPGDCCPAWSPNGDRIAFVRYSGKKVSIYIVSALGGTEHRVYKGTASAGSGIAWSPDGKSLVFPESSAADPTRSWVSVLSLADSSTRPFTSPPPGFMDHEPAFSPDGTKLAFVRSAVAGVCNDVYVMPATGGPPKRLTFDNRPIMGPPTWTADSKEIIFSSSRSAMDGLWRVSVENGTLRPVAAPVGDAEWPSIPAQGNSLVYEQWISRANIWQADLKDAKHIEKQPSPLVSVKGYKARPELSPDGKKIAFESDRLGFWDIWTCDVNGGNCDKITDLHGTAGRARWSPDGRYIAFEFHPHERSEIYVVEVPGGEPHLVPTIPGSDNLSPSWSRDGKWLYFASKRGDEPFQIWKMLFPGGSPVQLTRNGGIAPEESPDGRYLYYAKYEQGGIWRMPLQGGAETEVMSDVGGGGSWPEWALRSNGIYFLKEDEYPKVSIDLFEFAADKTIRIWKLEKEPGWGLSMSRDGKSIVYIQNEFSESNLMLVRNFK